MFFFFFLIMNWIYSKIIKEPGSIGNSLYDIDKKNYKSKSRKDYQIRKTYEDLQRELENLENEFKTVIIVKN